jgi:hypothetical protein
MGTDSMNGNLERAKELLAQLKRRGMCFDLMVEFFDRAQHEDNTDGMKNAYEAMTLIHKGDSK